MEGLWFVLAAVCVVAGVALLVLDRRRRRAPAAPAATATERAGQQPRERPAEPSAGEPGDLFREHPPR
ncbi:hypothetical protein I4I73_27610 [Pseudonocardia sp. KRD-184]|uniref:LPXTG-motif cell wall-anchored protein n=1 Tax=Pseudonocardia oceani TaxID=2792013 RepID=A0ABS6U7U5_9PSEU|nr:hypothetical protein [Pseudonocardia oceani]MBW0093432.1 hypothetical protein [Pseudonocardia oceani]MBW0099760.1 hypothetical protein [Pseudonocardia oceani]MBW0112870.1 hypothetical protein [Pseudonocardia oceani]MBW0122864.1 hypothetical protein [Pseudonocardia oceani]MBW0128282.1 hypothetical protein [Pseudonocardia oceani]